LYDLLLQKADSFESIPSVKLVYLFGSAAKGVTTPLSDIDIAYLDDGSAAPFDLEAELERVVLDIVPGASRIDLVNLSSAYSVSEKLQADFEENVVNRYLDYSEVLGRFYAEA